MSLTQLSLKLCDDKPNMHFTINRPVHQVYAFTCCYFSADQSLYVTAVSLRATHRSRILDQSLLMQNANKIIGVLHEQCCHFTAPLPNNRASNLSVVWFSNQELRLKHQTI